jgi:hypothetical protein
MYIPVQEALGVATDDTALNRRAVHPQIDAIAKLEHGREEIPDILDGNILI